MTEEPNESLKGKLATFLSDTFTLADVNYAQSIKDIKEGVSFRGFNIWILN
jgi:hypothetical protein